MNAAREEYLMAEIHTATPQKLRLMLIDAALRFVGQARVHCQSGNAEAASAAFLRARRAVTELLCGVKPGDDELARKVRSLYAYMFRVLTEAQLFRDTRRLDDVERLLGMEHETWQAVCQRQGEQAPTPIAASNVVQPTDADSSALPISYQA